MNLNNDIIYFGFIKYIENFIILEILNIRNIFIIYFIIHK